LAAGAAALESCIKGLHGLMGTEHLAANLVEPAVLLQVGAQLLRTSSRLRQERQREGKVFKLRGLCAMSLYFLMGGWKQTRVCARQGLL